MSAVPSPSKCVTLWVECNWDCIWEISSLRLDWIQHKCVAYVSCHVLLLSFPLVLASLSCLKKHTHMVLCWRSQQPNILYCIITTTYALSALLQPLLHTHAHAHTHTHTIFLSFVLSCFPLGTIQFCATDFYNCSPHFLFNIRPFRTLPFSVHWQNTNLKLHCMFVFVCNKYLNLCHFFS